MHENLIRTKAWAIDGWPMLMAFALYWVALVIFAMMLASGNLVA